MTKSEKGWCETLRNDYKNCMYQVCGVIFSEVQFNDKFRKVEK